LERPVDEERAPTSLAKPEWRQLTVLFCDVVGSTALGRRLDPEEWHRVIHQLHSRCGELVAKHHGYIAQYLGDGLLAYFGYPVAAEEAPRRAVTAALEIVAEVAGIVVGPADPLSVRIGIHTGPVIVGNIGSRRHQESLALGETPALAARLQEAAPTGGVVISPVTKRLVDGFFDCSELGPLMLKGFAQAQVAYRVTAERGARTRLEAASVAGLTPLVGRQPELSALRDGWSKVAAGGPASILVLSGEPGIGKSRLIHELKSSVGPTASVLELRCFQHVRTSILHPVIDCLQRLIGHRHADDSERTRSQLAAVLERAELTATQAALVLALFGVPIDPALAPPPPQLREATLSAIAAWLLRGPGPGPRLIVVEDVQWADPATIELLGTIFAAPPAGVAFVLSARPEFVPPWAQNVTALTLSRLGRQETLELVKLVAGNKPLPAEVLERLAARAESIPLFLEEMTKTVIDSGLVRELDGEYVLDAPMRDSAIPATLHDSLTGRLDLLGHGKPVAQLAAVLGREFRFGLFEAVWSKIPAAPGISLSDALERLVGAQLLLRDGGHDDPRYQFRHSLIQEAAYQSLLRSARQDYHRFAAEAIIERFPARAELEPELVAYHYTGAEERRSAVDYWSRAGQRAISSAAYVEAISHFTAGVGQVGQLPSGPESSRLEMGLRSALGVTLITIRGFASKEVEETYARASELCHELGDEIPVKVLYGIWAVNLVRSDLTSTTRMLPSLERLSGGADPGARLVGHAALSTWTFWRGEYERSVKHSQLANELVDRSNPRDQHGALLRDHSFEGLFYSGVYLAWAQVLQGDVAGARASWAAVRALAERLNDPYVTAGCFAFGSALNHDLGDVEVAAELSNALCELCHDKPFPLWHGVGLLVSGSCALELGGNVDEAIARISRGIEMYRATGATLPYAYHLKYLVEAYLAKGDVPRSVELLQESLALMRSNVERNFEPEILRLLGCALADSGNADGALSTLGAALDMARSQGARLFELKIATSLASVLRRRGDAARARDVLAPVAAGFSRGLDFAALRAADELLARL
jgi:class 3 adenylate cyclase/tetratricopeptide (TPR) repeat protein